MEILILGCPGLGHYNPCMQLANTFAKLGAEVTLQVPLTPRQAATVRCVDEIVRNCNLLLRVNDHVKVLLTVGPSDDMIVFLEWYGSQTANDMWNSLTMSYYYQCSKGLIKKDIREQIFDLQEYETTFMDDISCKPQLIISDLMVGYDKKLKELFNCTSYGYCPSSALIQACDLESVWQMSVNFTDLWQDTLEQEPLKANSSRELMERVYDIWDQDKGKFLLENIKTIPGIISFKPFELFTARKEMYELAGRLLAVDGIARNSREGVLVHDVAGMYHSQTFIDLMSEQKIYCIGPLFLQHDPRRSPTAEDKTITWLSTKNDESVVFVALGSSYDPLPEDVLEMKFCFEQLVAENPNCNVLWAYRETPKAPLPVFDNTSNILVVPWVNQLLVLQHPAIGVFVSHCGWNSLFEAIAVGHSPIVCLPVGAEQPFNAKVVEEYFKIGVRARINPILDAITRDRLLNSIKTLIAEKEIYQEKLRDLQLVAQDAWNDQGESRMKLIKIMELAKSKIVGAQQSKNDDDDGKHDRSKLIINHSKINDDDCIVANGSTEAFYTPLERTEDVSPHMRCCLFKPILKSFVR